MAPRTPKPSRPRPSAWSAHEHFRIEEIPAERAGDLPSSRLRHTRQVTARDEPDNALGDRLIASGEHRFFLTLNETHSATGSGVCLGVATPDGKIKVGVRPSDGRLVILPPPVGHPPGRPLGGIGSRDAGSHQRAVAARVEVIVDMQRRTVCFSLDGAVAVDSGVLPQELPDQLVPWASLFFKGDSVTISNHRHRSGGRGLPQPSPVRVPRSPPRDDSQHDAGPWTT
jgi:hypothetical protein